MKKLIPFFLLVTSCGPRWVSPFMLGSWEQPSVKNVCVDVPKETRNEILSAVGAWNKSLFQWKQFVVASEKGCDIYIHVIEPPSGADEFDLAEVDALFGREIKLFRGRYEIDPLGVTLHEMGHILGAKHMAETLMSEKLDVGKYRCPDAATVAQVVAVNGIDPGLISWCDPGPFAEFKK